MTKYKLGDRVKPVNAGAYEKDDVIYREKDEIGTIIYIKDWGREYLVEYDNKIPNGHSGTIWDQGDSKGKDGHCWWEYGSVLELVNTEELTPFQKLKIGEYFVDTSGRKSVKTGISQYRPAGDSLDLNFIEGSVVWGYLKPWKSKVQDKPQVYIVYECAEMIYRTELDAIKLAGGRIHAVKDNKDSAKKLKAKLEKKTKNKIAILTFDTESK